MESTLRALYRDHEYLGMTPEAFDELLPALIERHGVDGAEVELLSRMILVLTSTPSKITFVGQLSEERDISAALRALTQQRALVLRRIRQTSGRRFHGWSDVTVKW